MSTPYIGQIQLFPFNFAPKGWALCNGQLLPINSNQALFSLVGTFYGGDGVRTFALPNLQGLVAIGQGAGYNLGAVGGEAFHTLLQTEIPPHTHTLVASSGTPNQASPIGHFPAAYAGAKLYSTPANTTLGTGSSPGGGSQPHENRPPFLVLNFCIAITGIFPSRN